ncbi:MAG: phage tail sheath subtilisin-like domain-containing protein [Lentisphaeraceae bacterium]|nr:phage tail sheath subtilisin-like domain-containing protein [Lentisphaeraceae bacterium]
MMSVDYSKYSSSTKLASITFSASNPGTWGDGISVSADTNGITQTVAEQYSAYNLKASDLFNLTVYYNDQAVENFSCVTIVSGKNNPNKLDLVLEHESNYLRISGDLPSSFTPPTTKDAKGKVVPAKSANGTGGQDSEPLSESEDYLGDELTRTGLYALEKVDIFNLLCVPPDEPNGDLRDGTMSACAEFCSANRAMYIVDPPTSWRDSAEQGMWTDIQPTDLGINGDIGRYASVYFPRVEMPDPKMQDRQRVFPACGIIAGVMAATDLAKGVWKAPAGQDAGLVGVSSLELKVNDADNGTLNPLGINCLRNFPVIGPVVWGDRTVRGADLLSDDYKYVSVRRLTNYIEESLKRGTQWAVFEDNDESLWSQLRLSIGAFMKELSIQGAFYNYTVKCDASTTTADDIAKGIVNVEILFAPVKPAEFVVLKFQQTAAAAS